MTEWGAATPAYLRVAESLRARIESGEFGPGDSLPPVSALMAQYEIANSTAQKTLRALKAAGLVESRPGSGVFVRNTTRILSRSSDYISPVKDDQPAPYRAITTQLEIAEVVPPDDVAEALRTDDSEAVVRRSRVMVDKDSGKPLEIAVSYFPADIARGTQLATANRLKGGAPTVLTLMGYPPRGAREWVDTRMPTAHEARVLQLPPGVPVFRLLRIVWTDGALPIEALDMVFGGDRYRLEYDLVVHE